MKHTHKWKDTWYNAYSVAIEQRCLRCGEYRHHTSKDLSGVYVGDEPVWHSGVYPSSNDEKNREIRDTMTSIYLRAVEEETDK